MAPQENLNKIAQEFLMMDDYCSRVRKMESQQHGNPVQTSYQVRRNYGPPKTIDSFQAAKRYGGITEVTGRRPAVQGGMQGCVYEHQPDQDVVHKVKPVYEGGVWIMDYSKRKSRFTVF